MGDYEGFQTQKFHRKHLAKKNKAWTLSAVCWTSRSVWKSLRKSALGNSALSDRIMISMNMIIDECNSIHTTYYTEPFNSSICRTMCESPGQSAEGERKRVVQRMTSLNSLECTSTQFEIRLWIYPVDGLKERNILANISKKVVLAGQTTTGKIASEWSGSKARETAFIEYRPFGHKKTSPVSLFL